MPFARRRAWDCRSPSCASPAVLRRRLTSSACSTCTSQATTHRHMSPSSRNSRPEKKKPGTLSKAFSTHPQTPDRIKRTQQEIARILPAREQYVISTSEFDTVKARLAAMENRRKTIGPAKENQPSLRRTKGKDKDGKTTEDDRPTLQRRDDRQN